MDTPTYTQENDQRANAISAGARLLLGASRRARRGFYFEPTGLTGIPVSASDASKRLESSSSDTVTV
jgi:hypothetical protein